MTKSSLLSVVAVIHSYSSCLEIRVGCGTAMFLSPRLFRWTIVPTRMCSCDTIIIPTHLFLFANLGICGQSLMS